MSLRKVLAGKPRLWASLLCLLVMACAASARILTVPETYSTISDANAASIAEDTILVNRGIYPEQLRYPSHRIYVMSHYELTGDTLDVSQTVIEGYSYADHDTATIALFLPGAADGSKLCGFTLQGGRGIGPGYRCGVFLADSCSPVICHNVITQNQTAQTPVGEFWYCSGTFRGNHILDNEFGGGALRVFYNASSDPVLIEGNSFGYNSASPDAVWPGINLETGSRSLVRGNVFRGLSGTYDLAISGSDVFQVEVTNNVFDSMAVRGELTALMWLYNSQGTVIVHDNVFSNLLIEDGAAVRLVHNEGNHHMSFEGNVFEHIYRSDSTNGVVPGIMLQGYTGTIRNNIFRDNYGDLGSAVYFVSVGIGSAQPITLEYNLFEACSTSFTSPWTAAVMRFYNGPVVAHYNIFRHNYPRVVTEDHIHPTRVADFTLNYWGDPSGPYHPLLNPSGLGDVVGDSVLFDPWLTDSVISATPEPLPPLPEAFKLECYPNPFNPETRLKLTVAEPGRYHLELHDLLGRKVRDIFEGAVVIDREVTLYAGDLPSGVYFARARESLTLRPVATAKLALVK